MKINFPFNNDLKLIFKLLGYNCKLVGGCVRDYILKKKLVEDIDIATPFIPDKVISLLSNDFYIIPTGLAHGTLTIIGEKKYEITTLRKDDKTDGRHAVVSFNSSYEDDAARRDFTMNALYCDYEGNIYDYFEGLKDLDNGIVRFIGDAEKRIQEDFLRILRFFRFTVRFGKIDSIGLNACYKLKDGLKIISKERITQEWFKIISGKYFFNYFKEFQLIMKSINLFAKIDSVDYKKLSHLGLTALFLNEKSRLCLSKAQRNYINLLKNTVLTSQTEANIIYNKLGEHLLKDKMILENKKFLKIKIDPLPISPGDILELGCSQYQIRGILNNLEYIWYGSCGTLSKDDLIKEVITNNSIWKTNLIK